MCINARKIYDETIELKDNAMLKVRPELYNEWDFEKNDELGLNVYEMTKGMGKRVAWICENGHPWEASIINRCKGSNCPYCNKVNPSALKGYNDIWTTNPELANLLANPEDGYKYTQNSNQRTSWKCPKCSNKAKNKAISDIHRYGLSCNFCSDGIPYPEKFMVNLLKQLGVRFERDVSFKWSDNKRYDFNIVNTNIIIETHGRQHYEESGRGRNLKEEKAIDEYKYKMARENEKDRFIVIDCRHSNADYIKNNILNSELSIIFDLTNVNWKAIDIKSQKSIKIEILEMWNDGFTINKICETLGIHYSTANKALKKFNELNKCHYRHQASTVYQFDKDLNFIRLWKNTKEVNEMMGCSQSGLRAVCNGREKTLRGFIWRYEKDLIGWSVPLNT